MKKDIIIILFDGHGTAGDKGAVSGKFVEFEIAQKMCKAAYNYWLGMKKRSFKVYYPEAKQQLTISQQTELMDNYRRKGYFVVGLELHMNSASGTNGDGAEIWGKRFSKKGKTLGLAILSEWKKIGQNSRGYKVGDLQFTNYGKDVPLITEFGFVNNPKDRKIFDTDAEIKKAGVALAKACANVVGKW